MDEDNIHLAQAGDKEAVNQLVLTYQQPVFNLCYRMLGERTEAEDAAQEALVKAVMKLDTYDPERPFKPWVLRIASNECIDRIRRYKDTVSLDGMGDDGAWEWHASQSPTPEASLLQTEEQTRIRALLDTLSPEDCTLVTLFYWEGFSYVEIGDATGLSVSAIKSRLFRARRAMAEQLIQEESYAYEHQSLNA